MAIEDAAVLGRALAAHADEPPVALEVYEKERRPRVRRVWRAAKAAGELYHLGAVTGTIRDAGMEILGGRMLLASTLRTAAAAVPMAAWCLMMLPLLAVKRGIALDAGLLVAVIAIGGGLFWLASVMLRSPERLALSRVLPGRGTR